MQGSWNHGRAHYRCKLPAEYTLANKLDHTPTLYVREDHILPKLDEWLAGVFDPENLESTLVALEAAQGATEGDLAAAEAARRTIADCAEKVARLVDAIESGSPAEVLGARIKSLQGERLAAERALLAAEPADARLSREDLRAMIDSLEVTTDVLDALTGEEKAKLYDELGLSLTFHAAERRVTVEAIPSVYSGACRRGDLYLNPTGFSPLGVLGGRVTPGSRPGVRERLPYLYAPQSRWWSPHFRDSSKSAMAATDLCHRLWHKPSVDHGRGNQSDRSATLVNVSAGSDVVEQRGRGRRSSSGP